ncbi:MAG: AraC family transcriptional regulator [Ruminococcaceae bacterium]|nr:AraC family transcriptional regulator [Oscillospiraceae bacterium]
MYNTIEVIVLDIKNAEIKLLKKGRLYSERCDNVKHVKVLGYLSIVQSIEGSYDISIGNGETKATGDGGFFIAPAGVQQTIVHHINKKSGRMICRWLFIDVEINKAYKLDSLYDFPLIINDKDKELLSALFDRIFGSEDLFENYSDCYRLLSYLIKRATPIKKLPNKSVQGTIAYITEHYAERISVSDLANISNMSESNFHAVFKKIMGESPISYLNHYRLSLAAEALTETESSIGEISYSVGISDPLYFSKLFKKTYGMTPREYRGVHKR